MGSLYISYGADEENLFNNQYLVYLAIIPFVLITRYACLSSDSVRRNCMLITVPTGVLTGLITAFISHGSGGLLLYLIFLLGKSRI